MNAISERDYILFGVYKKYNDEYGRKRNLKKIFRI